MIRRNNNRYWSDYDSQYDDRRHFDDYQPQIVDRVVEVQSSAPTLAVSESSGFKLWSNGTLISICFSIITAIGGFVFKLYNNVTTLEYKQQTIFEKLEEQKQAINELKLMIKESDNDRKKIDDHISSIEETMMELYRRKSK